jgi:hypothetical protein
MAEDPTGPQQAASPTGAAAAPSPGPTYTAPAGPAAAATGPAPSPTVPTDDWPAQVADKIEQVVTTVRSQSTDRVVSIARLLVFGLLAAIMAVMAAVLGVAALVRALDELIPQEVWLTYLILGAIFTLAGLFLWSKKERRPSKV